MRNCLELFERTANLFPQKQAVVEADNSLTFLELKNKAHQIAAAIDQGLINQPIAIFLPKSAESVASFLGVLYSANFYVPLDVKSPIDRTKKIIHDLNPKIIITNSDFETRLVESSELAKYIILNIDNVGERQFDYTIDRIEKVIDTDPLYCIFTSGSTGSPKGVLISHRSVLDYISWAIETYGINEKSVIGNQAPFYFDNSILDIYLMFFTGARLVIISHVNFSFPHRLIEYLNEKKVNFIFWVPSAMTNVLTFDIFKNVRPKYLNKILFAGEVMPIKTLNYWRSHLKNALFSNLYGPTEITVACTFYIVDRDFTDWDSLPIGLPCRNTNIIVLNDENRRVTKDEVGELCVRGTSLALGYWNDFEKTNNAFIQNPLNKKHPELIYRTGDRVKYNDRGELMFLGREDFLIKHMGHRIELGEIEQITISLKGISNACALYDHDNSKINLFYQSDINISDSNVKQELTQLLPKYMIPSKIIKLGSLPLNRNGKVDREKLKRKHLD